MSCHVIQDVSSVNLLGVKHNVLVFAWNMSHAAGAICAKQRSMTSSFGKASLFRVVSMHVRSLSSDKHCLDSVMCVQKPIKH